MFSLRSLEIVAPITLRILLIVGATMLISGAPSFAQNNEDCDPAYPSVCIPSPPPDLNCGDIEFRRFEVLEPDPHRFDGDKDGIGCESG